MSVSERRASSPQGCQAGVHDAGVGGEPTLGGSVTAGVAGVGIWLLEVWGRAVGGRRRNDRGAGRKPARSDSPAKRGQRCQLVGPAESVSGRAA
ncbi:MAG TPA: hypothetical protein VFW38_07755 [Solirubrobacteraceae bacterium]|nr:hypothetical protein [Solirubrobacteraceae bacterium]